MYSNKNIDNDMNIRILIMTIKFIKDSERSDKQASSYVASDRTCTPPHMPKFTEACFLLHG